MQPQPSVINKHRVRLVLVLTIAGVFVIGILFYPQFSAEPRFGGKRLSVWLKDWYRLPPPGSGPMAYQEFAAKRRDAEAAVRHLGTNAVPMLTLMLRWRDSPLKIRLMQNRGVQWLIAKGILSDYLDPAWRSNRTAAQALSLLGASAKGAVPDLIAALEGNPDVESRRCAAACLGAIGPEAAAAVPVRSSRP